MNFRIGIDGGATKTEGLLLDAAGAIVARELAGRSVTCNAVAPGFITTDMTDELSDTVKEAVLAKIPLGTFGQTSDIAELVAYLASPAARYITGQVIAVDGGMTM